jgi:hypothetical protein
MPKNILLVHLVANGDCLMVTTLAKQIKIDFPNCSLTWAISYKCKQVILNNPYIDNIWEINYNDDDSPFGNVWDNLKTEIKSKDFDDVFYTQIFPDNGLSYDGTTRSSTFSNYPNKVTVPVEPVINLFESEVSQVREFVDLYQIERYKHRIIFECTPSSGQSAMTLDAAIAISEKLTKEIDSLIIIISTHINFKTSNKRIINGTKLSFRENAELSKYCTFLVGCSSGISWLLTSDWAKKLETIQIINAKAYGFAFASMSYDFKYWGLETNHIIEIDSENINNTTNIIIDALTNFKKAKRKHHEVFKPKLDYCLREISNHLTQNEYKKSWDIYVKFNNRNNTWVKLFFRVMIQFSRVKASFISRKLTINKSQKKNNG